MGVKSFSFLIRTRCSVTPPVRSDRNVPWSCTGDDACDSDCSSGVHKVQNAQPVAAQTTKMYDSTECARVHSISNKHKELLDRMVTACKLVGAQRFGLLRATCWQFTQAVHNMHIYYRRW